MSGYSESEATAVARLVKESQTVTLLDEPIPSQVLVFPDKTIKSLEVFAPNPKRTRASVRLFDVASFIHYLARFSSPLHLVVFGKASETGGAFVAFIDYHPAVVRPIEILDPKTGEEGSISAQPLDWKDTAGATYPDKMPQWGDHRVSLTLEVTPEWARWMAGDRKALSQEQFAEFIEDNLTDIIEPNAADLLDVAQMLQGKKTVTFKSGKRLGNGQSALEYTEEIATTGGRTNDTLTVPEKFKLGLVPFVGGDGVEITGRLRYRISDGGKLSFIYVLDRPHLVIRNAFNAIRDRIEWECKTMVMIGDGSIPQPPSA